MSGSRTGALFSALSAPTLRYFNGETLTCWPLGVAADAIEVENCLVVLDDEEGTNEELGDGAITRDPAGNDRERHSGWLEVPAGGPVDDRDVWFIDGEKFTVSRESGRDTGSTASFTKLRIASNSGRRTSRPRMRGDSGSMR